MNDPKFERVKTDIEKHKVLVYMKGTPQTPLCGFSAATVELLNGIGVPFETRDVIADAELRDLVPQFSNWPTFPQVFVNGNLIGGCDIVHELHERGELEPLLRSD